MIKEDTLKRVTKDKGMLKAVDIVNDCSQKDTIKILIAFEEWLKEQKNLNICSIMPEIAIAEWCLMLYNNKAIDKATIKYSNKKEVTK